MASVSADQRATRTIHTAACLIIGDEVLGGKVCLVYQACRGLSLTSLVDGGCELTPHA